MRAALWAWAALLLLLPAGGMTSYGAGWSREAVLASAATEVQESGQNGPDGGSQEDVTARARQELEQYDLGEVEQFLQRQKADAGVSFSFRELVEKLLAGRFMDVFEMLGIAVKEALFSQISQGGTMLAQIVVLGVLGAVFTNFSSVFTGNQISETGFFVTYLLLFTCLATAFFSSVEIAGQVLSNILDFMEALLPAYFLATAFAGGSLTSLAVCEFTLFLIGAVQWLLFHLVLPLVRVYILFVLAGHIAKEDVLTRLTDLIRQIVNWSMKMLLGLVLGFHILQGMVLPYVDSLKNDSVRKMFSVIPGIGQSADAVSQMLLGSGVLIKNTMGAAALIVLAAITLIPLLKLVVLMLLYQCVSAVMQPICDKRVVSCVAEAAQGHKMLLGVVVSSAFLFVITVAFVCGTTNVTYYTG